MAQCILPADDRHAITNTPAAPMGLNIIYHIGLDLFLLSATLATPLAAQDRATKLVSVGSGEDSPL